jgi:hypothetical protein
MIEIKVSAWAPASRLVDCGFLSNCLPSILPCRYLLRPKPNAPIISSEDAGKRGLGMPEIGREIKNPLRTLFQSRFQSDFSIVTVQLRRATLYPAARLRSLDLPATALSGHHRPWYRTSGRELSPVLARLKSGLDRCCGGPRGPARRIPVVKPIRRFRRRLERHGECQPVSVQAPTGCP